MTPPLHLAAQKNAAIRMLSDLVRIPTVNPPGTNYREMTAFLRTLCRRAGLTTTVLPVPVTRKNIPPAYTKETLKKHPRFNVLARWDTGARKTLHFNSHYDVVPASTTGWKSDPFQPVVRQGKLYGRGAHDMKDAIVATLLAVEALRACGQKPSCNVEISFTADEETGSHLGIAHLIGTGLLRADAAVVGEGASGNHLGIGHRGAVWWKITVLGRSAHGSVPHLGSNAFVVGCAVAEALRNMETERRKRLAPYRQGDGSLLYPTFMLGGESAGGPDGKVNIVPDEFHFTLDRRLLPSENVERAEKAMETLLARVVEKAGGNGYRILRLFSAEPCLTPKKDPFVRLFANAIAAERKTPPTEFLGRGFTDMHQLRRLGIPVVGYGPEGERIHSDNECSRIGSILQTAAVYSRMMLEYGG